MTLAHLVAAWPGAPRLPVVGAAVLLLVVVVVVCRKRGYTTTHRGRARVALYGAVALLFAAAAHWGSLAREEGRQAGLLTKMSGADLLREADPDRALAIFDEVLAVHPDDDNRRRARLGRAAALDQLERYDEAERAYGEVAIGWPAGLGRGALHLPWANMRLRAGRPVEALALLDAPGVLDGFGSRAEAAEVVAALRLRARSVAPGASEAGPAPGR